MHLTKYWKASNNFDTSSTFFQYEMSHQYAIYILQEIAMTKNVLAMAVVKMHNVSAISVG